MKRTVIKARPITRATPVEPLEDRTMMVYWPGFVGMDAVFQQYPWLNGGGQNVALIDKGVDYWHPRLGGNKAANIKAPDIVNVYDYNDNDTDPFPTDFGPGDIDYAAGHGTGVSGLLVMPPYVNTQDGNKTYQGVLQNSLVYNLRTSNSDSQGSITKALQWVVDNRVRYGITAVNLTDFIGTSAVTPAYEVPLKKLWDAGVFIITPVANDWLGDPEFGDPGKQPIGYPAKSPWIFGSGGLDAEGDGVRAETQRGAGLDVIAPAVNVWLPYYNATNNTHDYVRGVGNSWGTPMVLGTAVLIQQIDPTIKPAEVMKIIQDGGVYVADTAANASYTGIAGYKRLDMLGAVRLAYQVRDDASDQGAGNDTLANAATITLDSTGKGGLTARKLLVHDHDYYTFTTSAAGTYDLTTLAGAELLDSSGNVIATAGTDGRLQRALAAGKYYVHAYNATTSLTGTYSVAIDRAVDPPAALPASFTGNSNVITLAFTKDVSASLAASDLVVTPAAPAGAASRSPTSVTFDKTTSTARFVFATPLADGNYTAKITAASVADTGGRTLAQDFTTTFFTLAGDTNGDRTVNFADLLTVAKNYNGTGKIWADGDFTNDGAVNFADLLALAKNYNKALAAPAVTTSAPAPAFSPVSSVLRDGDSAVAAAVPNQPVFSTTRVAKPTPVKPLPAKRLAKR
jgi:hypothetical protein